MTTKGNPIPIRFDKVDEDKIRELAGSSGLSMRALIRSAVRYAIPRFASGEANILAPEQGDQPATSAEGK